MFPLMRHLPRVSRASSKGLYSSLQVTQPVLDFPPYLLVQPAQLSPKMDIPVEGYQSDLGTEMSLEEAKRILSLASDYQNQGPSVQGIQDNYAQSGLTSADPCERQETFQKFDVHSPVWSGLNSHVSLNGCMQSSVPQPIGSDSSASGYTSYLNMPGGGRSQLDKYFSGTHLLSHPSRHFSTSAASYVSQQGGQNVVIQEDEFLDDPTPQGIQGDNCVQFKLWMENCQRYNLPNCDEQIQSIESGRKTLAQVFMEQQEIIRLVAEKYKNTAPEKEVQKIMGTQGVQDSAYNYEYETFDPCPQGLQGDDCENYKFWAHNCQAFGFGDCNEKAKNFREGRKTLQEIFDEQDESIRKIVANYQIGSQQRRSYCTEASKSNSEVGRSSSNQNPSNPNSTSSGNQEKLSSRDQLKQAVKQYGATVTVFYIGVSLTSLGCFYVAVSSGLDVVAILSHMGSFGELVQSKIPTGATTFAMAYVIHKVFAPVRISLTVAVTPFLVRHLRRIGFLKPPKE